MAAFTTMAIIGGISAGISAYSQYKAGKAEKEAGKAQQRAAESQAELLDWNADIANQQAQDALDRGQLEEQKFRQGVDGIIGHQRAATAAGNVDVGFGSALDVQADAAFLGEQDALTIRTNAAREAWGFNVEAADTRKRAEISRKEGVMMEKAANARGNAAYLGAAGSVLGGAASLVQMRYGFTHSTTAAAPTANKTIGGS